MASETPGRDQPETPSNDMVSAYKSEVFTFLVGPYMEVYNVHQEVVASASEPFNQMLKRPMKENLEGKAILAEVEADTFEGFLDYAYTYQHKLAELDLSSLSSSMAKLNVYWHEPTEPERAMDNFSLAHKISPFFDIKLMRDPYNLDGADKVRDVFLFKALDYYARLYIFADIYIVKHLEEICLHKIRGLLIIAPPTTLVYNGILGMVPFIWKNTRRKDGLRQLWLECILVDPTRFMYQRGSNDLEPAWEDALEVDTFASDFMRAVPKGYWSEDFPR